MLDELDLGSRSSGCADAKYAALLDDLRERYRDCDVTTPGEGSCLPARVSDPLVTLASDIVEAYEEEYSATTFGYASTHCPEGLVAALTVFARPLVHTPKGQWAAKVAFTLVSQWCWPTVGFLPDGWPVNYREILDVALDAEAWEEFGPEAEYERPPRRAMPLPFVDLTPAGSRWARITEMQSGHVATSDAATQRYHIHVLSTGNHASYPSAVFNIWRALVHEYEFELEDHSFDTRYCELAGSCSIDQRFAWLGDHLRGTVVETCGGLYLKGFESIAYLANQFEVLLAEGGKSSLASRADILLCTHPPYSCRLFWPLVLNHGKPLVGFFGGTLEAHVPGADMYDWLIDFRNMAKHPRVQFSAISPFLAEKMRYQAVVDIPVARGFGFHVIDKGVTYFPRRFDDVLIWKNSAECEDNQPDFDSLLGRLLDTFAAADPHHLKFYHLRDLRAAGESGYADLASFRATVIVPYEVLTMTFYELYHLGMPMFVPRLELGVFFAYRGPVTYPHCDMTLGAIDSDVATALHEQPRAPYSPFSRDRATDRLAWLEAYSDWYQFPHLQYFSSLSEMVKMLHEANLQLISAGMRGETESALVHAAGFWKGVLGKTLSGGRFESI